MGSFKNPRSRKRGKRPENLIEGTCKKILGNLEENDDKKHILIDFLTPSGELPLLLCAPPHPHTMRVRVFGSVYIYYSGSLPFKCTYHPWRASIHGYVFKTGVHVFPGYVYLILNTRTLHFRELKRCSTRFQRAKTAYISLDMSFASQRHSLVCPNERPS